MEKINYYEAFEAQNFDEEKFDVTFEVENKVIF